MTLPNVTITGNLTADPELKFINNGTALATFTVAASDRKKDDSGKWIDGETTFLRVTVWRQTAENVAETLRKGSPVIVVGKLKQRDGEDRTGIKRTYFDLDAETVGLDLRRSIGTHEGSAKKDDPWSADSVPF